MSTLNAVPFRSTIFYTAAGTLAPAGSILTVAANGTQNFTSTLSAISFSTMAGSTIAVSSIVGTTTLGQNPSFPNRFIELGTDAVNTMYLDFHSSDAALPDYSTRIQSLGGATNGTGALNMTASTIGFSASNGVGVGTTSPTSVFTVNNAGAYRSHHLVIQGQEFYAAGNSSTGVAINVGTNRAANKQLWFMDPDLAINTTNGAIRLILGSTAPQIGGVSTDGTTTTSLSIFGNPVTFTAGSVGIGTATPSQLLHVYGDGARVRIETGTANNSVLELKTNSSISYLFTDQTGHLQIYPGSTSKYLLLQPSGGNVGIGTTAANAILNVFEVPINGDVTRKNIFYGQRNGTPSVQNGISMAFALGANVSSIDPYGALDIKLNGAPVAGNTYGMVPDVTVMSIIGNGKVGIGTTAPINTVHVYNTTADCTKAPDGDYRSGQILIGNSKSGTSQYTMAIGMDQAYGIGYMNAAGNGAMQPVCLNTRGANVGIGTTNPALPLSVGATYGVLNAVTFSLTAPSSVDSGLTLVAGGMYVVSVTTSGNTFGGNNQWFYHGIVLFNVSGISGYVTTPLQSNNITISVAGTGRVTVTTPGGSGTNSYSICAVRVC